MKLNKRNHSIEFFDFKPQDIKKKTVKDIFDLILFIVVKFHNEFAMYTFEILKISTVCT